LQRRRGQEQEAKRTESFVSDVEVALQRHRSDTLTLAQAAEETGYSKEHLGRMVREGKISNAGEKHSPRVHRGDLPQKISLSSPSPDSHLSREQIVRSVITTRSK
jgi:hypothetical protein